MFLQRNCAGWEACDKEKLRLKSVGVCGEVIQVYLLYLSFICILSLTSDFLGRVLISIFYVFLQTLSLFLLRSNKAKANEISLRSVCDSTWMKSDMR